MKVNQNFVDAYAEHSCPKSVQEYIHAVDAIFQGGKKYWDKENGKGGLLKIFDKKPPRYVYRPKLYFYELITAPFARRCDGDDYFSLPLLGYYLALTKRDMRKFQSAIYQDVRMHCLQRGTSGCDHSFFAVPAVRALAARDTDLFQKLLPESIGAPGQGHPASIVICTLLMGLWYKNEEILSKGLALARKRVTLKSETVLVKTVLRYLIALAENNADDMSAALDELCRTANRDKEGWLYVAPHPIADHFVLFAHGLYQLGAEVLDGNIFAQVALPSVRFDKEYAAWLTNAPNPGAPLVTFPGELSTLDPLITLIPETKLFRMGRQTFYDTEAFEEALTDGLAEQGIDLEAHFRQYNE